MLRLGGRLGIAFVVCLGFARDAAAQTVTDERVWFTLTLQQRPRPESHWRLATDVVFRSRDGLSALDLMNIRPTILYAIGSHSTVGGGYAFVPSFPATGATSIEHRWFGQYGWTGAAAGGTFSYRVRLEARFIEGNSGELTRLRQQLRFTHAVRPESRLSVSVFDEFFFHLNDTTRSPKGFDHNRLFGGLSFTWNSTARLDAGYLNSYTPGHRGAADRMYHVLSSTLVVSF